MQPQSLSFTLLHAAGQQPSPFTQATTAAPEQTPFWQVSPVVQAFVSLQAPPWFVGAPPPHTPFEHVSFTVHVLLSLQAPPLLPGTATQLSWNSSHEPMRHTSPGGAQVLGAPPQTPPPQTSLMVQKSPSSQGVPLFCGWGTHPSCESQTPIPHVLFRKEQSTCWPGAHTPPLQMPVRVQGSSSMQPAPSFPGTSTQLSVTRSHDPIMQVLVAGQNFSDEPRHSPPWQLSPMEHSFPSSHAAPSLVALFSHVPLMHVPRLHESESAAQSAAVLHGPGGAPPAPPPPPVPLTVVEVVVAVVLPPAPPLLSSGGVVTAVAQASGPTIKPRAAETMKAGTKDKRAMDDT
jgi:hypothetical protein